MKFFRLSGNMLKIIAAICMAVDHIGLIIFPENMLFRIIGRISFPIFAFLIAEGFRYTKNRLKYFIIMMSLALVYQIFYSAFDDPFCMNIFFTLSFAIMIISCIDRFAGALLYKKEFKVTLLYAFLTILAISSVYTANKYFLLDYGFWGCMLPAFAYVFPYGKNILCRALCLSLFTVGLYLLTKTVELPVQACGYLSVIFLILYSGKRGIWNLKYFFYIFYPLHLAVIYTVGMYIKK